jgi:hypothetical protein
MLAGSALEALA